VKNSLARSTRRRGERWIVRVPHEGHTSGSCARSAAMSASASGARYSLIPRLPTATPLPDRNLYYPDRDALPGGSGGPGGPLSWRPRGGRV